MWPQVTKMAFSKTFVSVTSLEVFKETSGKCATKTGILSRNIFSDPKTHNYCNQSMSKTLQQDEIENCCNIKECKVVNMQRPTLPTVILAHLSVSAEFVFAQITRCSEMTACAISFVFFYWHPPTWENRMWKITSTHAWINLFYICTMYRSEPQFVVGLHSSDRTVLFLFQSKYLREIFPYVTYLTYRYNYWGVVILTKHESKSPW